MWSPFLFADPRHYAPAMQKCVPRRRDDFDGETAADIRCSLARPSAVQSAEGSSIDHVGTREPLIQKNVYGGRIPWAEQTKSCIRSHLMSSSEGDATGNMLGFVWGGVSPCVWCAFLL